MTARSELTAGVETMTRLLAGTLGPGQGHVLSAVGRNGSETLSDSATVVRRITALPGRRATAGASIVRDMVLRLGEEPGDGGATAAVLARGMLAYAGKLIAAGANPVLVRRGIQAGVGIACDALKVQAEPVDGEPELTGLATAATGDAELGALIGELLDVLGATGAIQVEEIPDPRFEARPTYDFIDGARWRARPAHRDLLPEGKTELTLIEPTVVVADCELKRVEQIRPLLELAPALPGRPPLLIVARDIGDDALTMLAVNDRRGLLVSAPVVLTTARTRMADDLADLALLTGAEVLSEQAGTPPDRVRGSQLGTARRVLVQRGQVTIRDGGGDRAEAADRAARLRIRASGLTGVRDRDRLWLRQARLIGKVAALRVHAQTEQLLETRKAQARKAIRLAGAALREGVVPGGGVAYADCVPAVRSAREQCASPDEAAGLDAVCAGLEAPFLQLVGNAGGLEPRTALAKARELGPGHGVDVRTHTFAHMVKAGVRDVTTVATGALRAAGETAGMLVSAEVVSGRG